MARPALTSAPVTGCPCVSKSKFLSGCQCPKLLWHIFNAKEQIPAPGASQQAIFDQGHTVGKLAKALYPGGIEVSADAADFGEVLSRSLAAAKLRKPLFEAGFVYNGGYARADILNPVGREAWDLIEVKSSTDVKDLNLTDLAFQTFVYTGAGLKISRCCVMHVDRDYVRQGDVQPEKFFKLEDVTSAVAALSRAIGPQLEEMFTVIRQKLEPDIKIGPHCSNPYPCPLQDKCWAFLPEQNVTTLYRAGKKAFKLLADGVNDIRDIPSGFKLTANQEIQRTAAQTGHAPGQSAHHRRPVRRWKPIWAERK